MNTDDPLEGITIQFPSGRSASLRSVVDSWTQHVTRLYAERHNDLARNPSSWGAHDYLAALYIRDRVAIGLAQAPLEVANIAQARVTSADRLFLSYAEPDTTDILSRFERVEHDDSAWWWKRIPATGPAREELIRAVSGNAVSLRRLG